MELINLTICEDLHFCGTATKKKKKELNPSKKRFDTINTYKNIKEMVCPTVEIRCVFDDYSKIIFVKSSKKPMLWVLIRIVSNEHPQHRFFEEIRSKIIT